jgi:sugar phosphate isomerase/epimerase
MLGPSILHSISYAGLWGQAALPLDAFIEKAADLGYEGVMLTAKRPHLSLLDYGPKERARLRSQLERRGLGTVVIAGYNNFTADLEHGEVPHREMQIHHITELSRLAHDLGGRVVRIFTGYEHPAQSYTAQWKMIVDCLRECARRAAEYDVIIGVQNHHDVAVGHESFLDLLRTVNEPNCRALFDAWAPVLHGVDAAAAACTLGEWTVHTTVADYQLRPRYHYDAQLVNYRPAPPLVQAVPMGEGIIDYKAFFAALAEGGFRGSIAYEMCSPLVDGGSIETLDRYARHFLEYMSDARAALAEPAAARA